ncbi:MAG TPA: hypothetical protein VFV28_01280 [Limnobacter sp.]|nr:hypothetical protein [Limnobacter sp.]
MNNKSRWKTGSQSGAAGIFFCIAIVAILGLIGLQNITATSSKLYLSNTRQSIEEARQLAFAGLRYYTHNYGSDEGIAGLIEQYRDNPKVVGECSTSESLPDTLDPTVILLQPSLPDDQRLGIFITGMVVPYNCSKQISDDNFRAAFEIVASVNCSQNQDVEAGCVKRSFVFNRQDNDDGKLTYLPIKPPPKPPRPAGEDDDDDRDDDDKDKGKDNDDDDDSESKPPRPKSRGKQEVGF